MRKRVLILVTCCSLLFGNTVSATKTEGFLSVSGGDVGSVAMQEIDIPNVVGMNYEEATSTLENLPIEIIKNYEFSNEYEEGIIMGQNLTGVVQVDFQTKLTLTISQGQKKTTTAKKSRVLFENGGTFGIGNGGSSIIIDGNFEDWAGMPYSWEYGHDNSNTCWGDGEWVNGVCYKYPEGTFDENVRHKMSLYCDGEYVYLYIMIGRNYSAGFNGEDYRFTFDGQIATFQVNFENGASTNYVKDKAAGIYNLQLKHRNGALSYTIADGAQGYLKIKEDGYNNEMELKIPLETIQQQNPNINTDHIGTIQFEASQLTYRPITASGADTMPYVWASLALLLIPLCYIGICKYYNRKRA